MLFIFVMRYLGQIIRTKVNVIIL